MATLSHFPSFFSSLSPHKLYTFHSPPALNVVHRHHQHFHQHPPRKHFAICCSSIRKPRASKKVMSDVDLCNELKDFISSVGFEEGHVPSMKDLSQHGRKDLAHIVRRRGYKLITELLANSRESGIDESDIERDLVDKRDVTADWENETTGQGEKVDNLDEDVSLSTEAPILDSYGSYKKMDPIMKEDDGYGFLHEIGAEVFKGNVKLAKAVVTESKILDEEHPENLPSGSNDSASLNGNIETSEQIAPPATGNYPLRDGFLSTERLIGANSDKDFEVETSERENQVEINHLKLMLHQKELELSRLKEQIEKEKIALSALQIKAESEISKARKLVSEKDEELNAAEESLSGLKEVQIQYQADGEIVEVAGSFNGWHHRVQLDPQPSSSIVDPIGSRKSRLWSTVLWLYPGEYEIKFVVDGQWMIDPHRESITRGTILNNILRVDR